MFAWIQATNGRGFSKNLYSFQDEKYQTRQVNIEAIKAKSLIYRRISTGQERIHKTKAGTFARLNLYLFVLNISYENLEVHFGCQRPF